MSQDTTGAGIHKGSWVRSADGQELGRISEITAAEFKVSAPMVADYWLKKNYVADVTDGTVGLSVSKEQLLELKQPSPADTAQESGQAGDEGSGE
jgi:hypothetical protein